MTDMSDERITEALNALRRADFDIETDPAAEIRTLLTFRRQQRHRRFRRVAISMATSAAAAALLLTVSHSRMPETSAPVVAVDRPPALPPPVAVAAHEPVARKITSPPKEPEEIATDFYPLMVSAPPLERGLLVRVTVPASTMRAVGLKIGDDHLSDPVEADVLVGQDDLARAIRFISYRK
jgi:hypothetical protein